MRTGFATDNLSSKYFEIQSAYVVTLDKAINSVSTVNSATVSCLFVSYDIGLPATINIFPFVDLLVVLHPAKLVST